MHQPRPYGLLSVGGELTDEDRASVELLARRLTNLRELSSVDSLRMVRALPNGGYVIAQNMGGMFRVITHKNVPPPPVEFEGIAVDYIPMLFSGVITAAVVHQEEGVGINLTEMTRRRIAGYQDGKKPPKSVRLQRFRIEYSQMTQELAPQTATNLFYSQYAAQRPTWYSGAMAEVMQIVGGYGKQQLKDLPDNPTERARMKIPDAVIKAIREEMGNIRLPGYTGLPNVDDQFQYDYKFNDTHGVGFDSTNKPWLIKVGSDGVHAMPLPMIPATTTQAFRDYVTEKHDDELLAILDRFGGMPSGEGFPVGYALPAWKRAGVVIKICDTADFYQHIAYSSACGWSFNSKGTEGYNTCFDYHDEEGLGYGMAFKMKLSLGESTIDKLPPPELPDDPNQQRLISTYLGDLFKLLKSDATGLAIKYKIRRVPIGQILSRAGNKPDQDEVDYWDNLELDPIASHGGSVTEVGRGYLYNGSPFMYQPQIKFPEPFMGGCISHDFLPLANGVSRGSFPNSDTIMFGYYIGDELCVVKYFRDGNSFKQEIEGDFDECMIVGSWTQTVTDGPTSLVGNFYTSNIDERKLLPQTVTTTQVVGKDLGKDSIPFFAQDFPFASTGSLYRNRYFSTHTKTHRSENQSLETAICIPYLCRNAALHAKRESTNGTHDSEVMGMFSITDPYSYRWWTYDFVFAWAGSLEVEKGSPFPKDGNPVWVEMEVYDPGGQCSDFPDSGPWITSLPTDYTWLVHPNRHVWQTSGGGNPPKFKEWSSSSDGPGTTNGDLKVSIQIDPKTVFEKRVPEITYFLGSPDPYVGIFYRDACRVVFGDTVYANVSESAQEKGSTRRHFGYCSLADHRSAHHFIGVINE